MKTPSRESQPNSKSEKNTPLDQSSSDDLGNMNKAGVELKYSNLQVDLVSAAILEESEDKNYPDVELEIKIALTTDPKTADKLYLIDKKLVYNSFKSFLDEFLQDDKSTDGVSKFNQKIQMLETIVEDLFLLINTTKNKETLYGGSPKSV